jgi:hypothetical protein
VKQLEDAGPCKDASLNFIRHAVYAGKQDLRSCKTVIGQYLSGQETLGEWE